MKANGCAELLRLLRELLGLPIAEVGLPGPGRTSAATPAEVRHARTRALLDRAAARAATTPARCSTTRCCAWRSPGTRPTWSRT